MVDFELFLNWCEKHFDSVKISGREIKLNSIFDPNRDDQKHKLWCNPDGGKTGSKEEGAYHCWISGATGTLVYLVMKVTGCSRDEALDILDIPNSLKDLENRIDEFFADPGSSKPPEPEETPESLDLPDGVIPIRSLYTKDPRRVKAEEYLANRKLSSEGLLLGISGDQKDRIVIPYYDEEKNLIYYNGRHLWKSNPKYLGPEKGTCMIGKGDVIYMPSHPPKGSTVYIVEGEFDALTLIGCGLHGVALGGSEMSRKQFEKIKNYSVVLAADNDVKGHYFGTRVGDELLACGYEGVKYVKPPDKFKDWNDLRKKAAPETIKKFIESMTKDFRGVII